MLSLTLGLKEALEITAVVHSHARKCDGTTTIKLTDPETGMITKIKEPCKLCLRNTERMSALPPQMLSQCLEEPEGLVAHFQLATLIVDSTLNRGGHKGKRAERDVQASMDLLRFWRDECDGKLRD